MGKVGNWRRSLRPAWAVSGSSGLAWNTQGDLDSKKEKETKGFHCGQRTYFVWLQAIYIYWDWFHSLASSFLNNVLCVLRMCTLLLSVLWVPVKSIWFVVLFRISVILLILAWFYVLLEVECWRCWLLLNCPFLLSILSIFLYVFWDFLARYACIL